MFGYAGWETIHEEKTRVLLIEGGSELEAGIPPNLGILVASINNSGHEVRVFSLNDYKSQDQTGDEIRVNTLQVPPSQEDVIYKVKDTDINEVIGRVLKWFREHRNWLIIYDNADDLGLLKSLLPDKHALGHVLLTTRAK